MAFAAEAVLDSRRPAKRTSGHGWARGNATELGRHIGVSGSDGETPQPPPFPVRVSKAPHRPLCAALSFSLNAPRCRRPFPIA